MTHTYIVIRRRLYLDYTEYLGPVVSTRLDIRSDANRLYGKPGHAITWIAYSHASLRIKELLNQGIV